MDKIIKYLDETAKQGRLYSWLIWILAITPGGDELMITDTLLSNRSRLHSPLYKSSRAYAGNYKICVKWERLYSSNLKKKWKTEF